MDDIQKIVYRARFNEDFHSKNFNEFQDWFARIASHSFGIEFVAVKPYGRSGDLKCDGYHADTRTVYQCYAPYKVEEQKLIAKIKTDFEGAVENWPDLKSWVLVLNDHRGLPAKTVKEIEVLKKTYPPIQIKIWSRTELYNLVMKLEIDSLVDLFGVAPTREIFDNIELKDLEPIIQELDKIEPEMIKLELTPPTLKKLDKNGLSSAIKELMMIGRQRSAIVEEYFRNNSENDLGERIAEAFRRRYEHLSKLDLSPDEIFTHLQDFAGFRGEPKRQVAALAILVYFFDRCDIFEDSDIELEQS